MTISSTDGFNLGIAHIDDAHQDLFVIINKLGALIDDLETPRSLKEKQAQYLFNRLLDYTVTHFVEEELLMELYHVPGRYAHKRIHRKMEQRLVGFYYRFKSEGLTHLAELHLFLENWWMSHILYQDKKDLADLPHADDSEVKREPA